jgi:hypothetical protein
MAESLIGLFCAYFGVKGITPIKALFSGGVTNEPSMMIATMNKRGNETYCL